MAGDKSCIVKGETLLFSLPGMATTVWVGCSAVNSEMQLLLIVIASPAVSAVVNTRILAANAWPLNAIEATASNPALKKSRKFLFI
ncbi:hypothetical protein D3C72_1222050 [compost metagenome]